MMRKNVKKYADPEKLTLHFCLNIKVLEAQGVKIIKCSVVPFVNLLLHTLKLLYVSKEGLY